MKIVTVYLFASPLSKAVEPFLQISVNIDIDVPGSKTAWADSKSIVVCTHTAHGVS